MKYILALIILLTAWSCKEEKNLTDDQLLGKMEEVYGQIEDLIQTSCTSADQCIATALGVKPCGGPTTYIVHNSTNQGELDELVEQYNDLNSQYNEATNAISDCSLVSAPTLDCISGNCRAAE